jgi:hypothetical protein
VATALGGGTLEEAFLRATATPQRADTAKETVA